MEEKKESFLTRLFARKVEESDEPILDERDYPRIASTLPQTLLQFTPEQDEKYSVEEKIALLNQLKKVPPLRLGEINFVPFECGRTNDGGYYLKVFIRHGRDLLEEFTLPEMPLYLIDATGEKVAGGYFKPTQFGTLKFGETRVWTFFWSPNEVMKQDADLSHYSVAFQ